MRDSESEFKYKIGAVKKMKKIWLAGGCFWGVEAYFQQLAGVVETKAGYAQGNIPNPTYEQVCTGTTMYTETVEISYDETRMPLDTLLHHMFRFIDPTSLNKQGGDRGTQYRTGIYYQDNNDDIIAREFLAKQQVNYKAPIVVEVEPLKSFYVAEDYHQDYLLKNPNGYCHINLNLVLPDERKK